jgi:hypothetical protein
MRGIIKKTGLIIGCAMLVATACCDFAAAGYPDGSDLQGMFGIALGKACGLSRDGQALDVPASEKESMCVYPTANVYCQPAPKGALANCGTCTEQSCCKTITTAPAGGSTQLWDNQNGVCKQGAGTIQLSCPKGGALFGISGHSWIMTLPGAKANTVADTDEMYPGIDSTYDGIEAAPWGNGQVCVYAIKPLDTPHFRQTCEEAGGQYAPANEPGVTTVPGYYTTDGCLGTYQPSGTDVPYPGMQG